MSTMPALTPSPYLEISFIFTLILHFKCVENPLRLSEVKFYVVFGTFSPFGFRSSDPKTLRP